MKPDNFSIEQEEDSQPLYYVNATVEGADDSPADNGFDDHGDAIELMEQIAREYEEEGIKDWEVAVYDTFENQNKDVLRSADAE